MAPTTKTIQPQPVAPIWAVFWLPKRQLRKSQLGSLSLVIGCEVLIIWWVTRVACRIILIMVSRSLRLRIILVVLKITIRPVDLKPTKEAQQWAHQERQQQQWSKILSIRSSWIIILLPQARKIDIYSIFNANKTSIKLLSMIQLKTKTSSIIKITT